MKDEEMAEEGLNKRLGTMGYLNKQNVARPYTDGFKDGFLAGLKAGRPQWHEADIPTSPINKIVLGYIKDYNTKKFCLVKWNGEWWYDARTWNDKVKLIAWKEIVLP